MEISSKNQVGSSATSAQYPSVVQLYTNPPTFDVSVDEFNELATTRQKVLQETSNLQEKVKRGDLSEESYKLKMRHNLKRFSLIPSSTAEEHHFDERRRDLISHYILRLAYCESEDLRRWFLSQEVALLQFRLSEAQKDDFDKFLDQYYDIFPFVKIEVKEKDAASILSFYGSSNNSKFSEMYKVHFTEVLDLVQRRTVIIRKGYVILPVHLKEMTITLVTSKFRSLLSRALVRTVSFMKNIKGDERVCRMIKHLRTTYKGDDFGIVGSKLCGQVSLQDLDMLSVESFPPCMKHLHDTLRRDHHLRHFGRLQYGLFLKSIGISLDEALKFWRDEFTKKMDQEKFEKQHAYNIRHSYGREGKRTSYTPYSCLKIILSNGPGVGDHHGCPFKHWDSENIQNMLKVNGVPVAYFSQIMEYVDDSHYQLACQKYFDITHKLEEGVFSLEHPTQYFIESRQCRLKLKNKEVTDTSVAQLPNASHLAHQ